MNIHKLTLAALLVAIGTLSAHLVYIPAGASKCFPVQHARASGLYTGRRFQMLSGSACYKCTLRSYFRA